jgi:phage tail sheath protein FI
MPEYLAPGVYVEETSFRAKSIEGVSTSTTAFVGPTRRGPTTGTPELVTSYADFERIYGGFGPVHGRENYLAHGVRAYFNEGGARLYVARVFTPPENGDGRARSAPIVTSGDDDALFVARFPGAAGNGRVRLRKIYQPANLATMANAHEGTLLRIGGDAPAEPARVLGARASTFSIGDGQTLVLEVGVPDDETPNAVNVTFNGTAAVVSSVQDADVAVGESTAEQRTVRATVNNGTPVEVVLPDQNMTPAQIAAFLQGKIPGVTVAPSGNNRFLTFTTQRRGTGASLKVASEVLGLPAEAAATVGTGTVPDLSAVTPAHIDTLVAGAGVRVGMRGGRLELRTAAEDAESKLRVGTGTANAVLGLPEMPADTFALGRNGPVRGWYALQGGAWLDAEGGDLDPDDLTGGADFVTLFVETEDGDGNRTAYEGLALGEGHPRFLGGALSETPSRRSEYLEQPYAFIPVAGVGPLQLHDALFAGGELATVELVGGDDGAEPSAFAYETALRTLLPLEDISILAAPGSTAYASWEGIQQALITHAERPRSYQIVVLDTQAKQEVSGAREARSRIDSKYAALYYPWVSVANPAWRPGRDDLRREIDLPPSGFVAGIYARNDVQRGVHKAPANEVVRGAIRFETDVNFDEQGVLNPIGVNCLRFFPGRGNRVWGARTASSDPEWKYVNVRRYFNYVERSIDVGTQWAVFEPNGEALWANVRQTIASFLYNEWRNGALLGTDPKQAYFVRCDRSTMTQNDLDNGRLVCLVGLAVVKPAEFVIFRIGQKTADARE